MKKINITMLLIATVALLSGCSTNSSSTKKGTSQADHSTKTGQATKKSIKYTAKQNAENLVDIINNNDIKYKLTYNNSEYGIVNDGKELNIQKSPTDAYSFSDIVKKYKLNDDQQNALKKLSSGPSSIGMRDTDRLNYLYATLTNAKIKKVHGEYQVSATFTIKISDNVGKTDLPYTRDVYVEETL